MGPGMDELKKFCAEKKVSYEALAKAAGVDLSTFYRKMNKGRGAFTIGEVQGMVEGGAMPRENAIIIFLPHNSH